jgi:hypothetical protein
LLHFNEICFFSTDFSKKIQISDLMKIRPVAAELFHADGQIDTTKIGRFSLFVNLLKNGIVMRTNHYEARRTLSALHEIHTEWYLLE